MMKLITVSYNVFEKEWEVTSHWEDYKFIHPYKTKMKAMSEAFKLQLDGKVSVWVYTKDYTKKDIYPF